MRREILLSLFEACNNPKSVSQLHSQTLKLGLTRDSFFATKLTTLYSIHALLKPARKVFDETPHKTVYLWNAMLRSHCREKQWEDTLCLFRDMVGNWNEEKPDVFTIPIALKACVGLRGLEFGKMIHGFVKKNEKVELDMFVGSALIELYSKCGQMSDASKVFKEFAEPDVVLWTSMVTGYEQNSYPEEAVAFFSKMVMVGRVSPDPITLVSLVSAGAQLVDSKLGGCVLGFVMRRGFETDLTLVNSLLNLYEKTGCVKIAANLFRKMPEKDVISWSSMVACYAHNGAAFEAIDLFDEMIDRRIEPNSITMVSALQACAVACNLEEGKKFHELAAQKGFELDVSVSTALIDMYMKCSAPDEAADLFERIPRKDVVSWAAFLSGYAQNGLACKSMGVFCDMLSSGSKPDAVAMVKILTSCSELGILQQAVCLHGYVIRTGFNDSAFVGASLMELYSKCGSLGSAIKIFEGMIDKDVVIWSAMISAYGIHGQGAGALKIFDQMVKNSAVRPNNVTFLSALSACSHAGLVAEGFGIFDMMVHKYQLDPASEHYGIMVDLLGRTGELDKAMDIINQIPFPAGPDVWGALLGACRIHHNVQIGEVAAKNLFRLDPNHAGYYILLSNIYALDGKWSSMAELRTQVKEKGLKKMKGKSVVEVRSEVHSFIAGDRFHQESEQIYGLLKTLETKMREDGYTPDVQFLLNGPEEFLKF